MRPTGEDTAKAVTEWFAGEIKNSSSSFVDLGKFFFGASSGALGLVLTITKIGDRFVFTAPFSFSLVLYSVSLFIAVFMVQPRIWLVTGDTDLYEEYRSTVHRGIRFIWTWFTFWIFATIFAVVTLYGQTISKLPAINGWMY